MLNQIKVIWKIVCSLEENEILSLDSEAIRNRNLKMVKLKCAIKSTIETLLDFSRQNIMLYWDEEMDH